MQQQAILQTRNNEMDLDDVMFLGIQTAPSRRDPGVAYPVAVGIGFPDLRRAQTIPVRPKEDWDIFAHEDPKKGEWVAGTSKSRLLAEGRAPHDVVQAIVELKSERSQYSAWPERDITALRHLLESPTAPRVHSAMELFSTLSSATRMMTLELRYKLDVNYYPKSAADVRWMVLCCRACIGDGFST